MPDAPPGQPAFSSPSIFSLPAAPDQTLTTMELSAQGGFPFGITDQEPYWMAPAPIAVATLKLLEETPLNSTDELIHLLEVWLRHLGWMWIVEYLAATWQDDALNRLLFAQLYDSKRAISVGAWAYLGSHIAHLFAERGEAPHNPHLQAFEYGSLTDENSHLSRLLRYRNSFAHGSFAAIIQDITEHRGLLWELVEPLEHLVDSPIIFWDQEASTWRMACGHWQPYDEAFPAPSNPGTIYQLTPTTLLDLSHVCSIRSHAEQPLKTTQHLPPPSDKDSPRLQKWELCYLSPHDASRQQKRQLFAHQTHTKKAFVQFRAKRQGQLNFDESFAQEKLPTMPPEAWSALLHQLQQGLDHTPTGTKARPRIIALLGYPGSGKTGIIAQAQQLFDGFTHAILYRMNYRDLTTSAVTCARYLIRALAEWLQRPEWLESLQDTARLPAQLTRCLRSLEEQPHQRLLLGFDQFHLAYEPYQEETLSIYDLISGLQDLPGQQIAIMLAARPGYRDDMLGDTFAHLPIAEYAKREKYEGLLAELGLELRESSRGLSQDEVRFRRTILFLLGSAPHPLSPFALCEVFERLQAQMPERYGEISIFTPHVERCLWELRPILRWERETQPEAQERELRYAPFCSHLGQWLAETLRP